MDETIPALNASLNFVSIVALVLGRVFIFKKSVAGHRACMLVAFGASILFLVGYVTQHALFGSRAYAGPQEWRTPYLIFLGIHMLLAATNLPLIVWTLVLALRRDFSRHKRIAPVTFGAWLYVAVTGLVIYFVLY